MTLSSSPGPALTASARGTDNNDRLSALSKTDITLLTREAARDACFFETGRWTRIEAFRGQRARGMGKRETGIGNGNGGMGEWGNIFSCSTQGDGSQPRPQIVNSNSNSIDISLTFSARPPCFFLRYCSDTQGGQKLVSNRCSRFSCFSHTVWIDMTVSWLTRNQDWVAMSV